MKNKYNVIGLMSGTSLDGLDIACVEFRFVNNRWRFSIIHANTVPYSKRWHEALSTAHQRSGEDLLALHAAYGQHLGNIVHAFIREQSIKKVDFIASHGHTVFHQPKKGFTFQLGDGNALHATCGIPVISDFRSLDVARGGEGAPLVPVGDQFLFGDYEVCLNLGGIANLSTDVKGKRIAYDICFCNMALNYLTEKLGKTFDKNGALAASGDVNSKLLTAISRIYKGLKDKRPSLGRELFERKLRPLLDDESISIPDKLSTCVESVAQEVAGTISGAKHVSMLCTGGGAFNAFMISRILEKCGDKVAIIVPDEDIIKFKEAIVFGFLGVLRVNNLENCLHTVTRASRSSSGGIMIGF